MEGQDGGLWVFGVPGQQHALEDGSMTSSSQMVCSDYEEKKLYKWIILLSPNLFFYMTRHFGQRQEGYKKDGEDT